MESVWKILDYDYGLEIKEKLRTFVPTGKTIAEKFTKLFKVYTEVKDILMEFGRLYKIDNPYCIQGIMTKFPYMTTRVKYAHYRAKRMTEGRDFVEFDIMDEFMEKEHNIQQDMFDIQKKQKRIKSKLTTSNKKNKNLSKSICFKWGISGHRRVHCNSLTHMSCQ